MTMFSSGIVLREFKESDVRRIHEISLADGFNFYSLDKSFERAEAFVSRAIGLQADKDKTGRRKSYKLAVTLADDPDNLVGYVACDDLHAPEDGTPDVGYLIDPAFQGRGLATEAMKMLLRFCYAARSNLDRLHLTVDPRNIPSQKVAAKLSFGRVDDKIHNLSYGLRLKFSTDRNRLIRAGIIS